MTTKETAAQKRKREAAEKKAAAEAAAQKPDETVTEPNAEPAAESEAEPEVTWTAGTAYPQDVHNAERMAVRVRSGGTMWRSGMKFDADWRIVARSETADAGSWLRIAAEPLFDVREAVKAAS